MALTYCPALQVVHAVQALAFVTAEKVPVGHALHVDPFT